MSAGHTCGLPSVAVLYEAGAFSPLTISEAAAGLCHLVWVTGWSEDAATPTERLLRRLGTVVPARRSDPEGVVAALAAQRISGVAVFTDAAQELAAVVAERLDLPFHSRMTARRLRDKLAQRQALQAAGLVVPAVLPVDPSTVRSVADAADLAMTWPAVLKPRRGTGGSDTFLVTDPSHLATLLTDGPPGRSFILEEYLPDRSAGGRPAADMVSVELVVADGTSRHLAISGRFPILPPLRENGGFLPSDLGADDSAAVVATATAAAAALGVERGILHVEIKLTPDGPRVVEVNGRVGGIVPELLRRVGGPPVLTWALRLSLGLDVGPFVRPDPRSPVAYYYAWLPPVGDFRVTGISGFDRVVALPGVDRAGLNRQVGDRVSSREGGMFGHLATAYGTAATHDELWRASAALETALSFDLAPADAALRSPVGARR